MERNRHPAAGRDLEPVIRFNKFSDSNINFTVALKGNDRAARFVLKHEFIKELHKRHQTEGIEIQYPVRKVLFGGSLPQDKR